MLTKDYFFTFLFLHLFILTLFLLTRYFPGQKAEGVVVENKPRIYLLNGLFIFILILIATAVSEILKLDYLIWINKNFAGLFISANIFAFAVTFILYSTAREQVERSGDYFLNVIKGIICGVQKNPEWWQIDLKFFSYRPSLIGLALINLSFAAVQYQKYGQISDAMLLYQLFTIVYIFNYFQFEYGMLFTWDIIAEKFGWMLVWGDYVLVPFFYSLPGWFLIDKVEPVSKIYISVLIMLFIFGFWLFRGANEQKHQFKRNPSAIVWGEPAKSINGRLLTSGFWGIGRHLNYSGEICIYFAFTLTTGFNSIMPYLLPVWLTILLVHRAWRDDVRCRNKYGDLWQEYTNTAKFRMIPFLY